VTTSAIVLPDIFKGIALFTPGGDLIYCIDPDKQTHWHLNLCAALQSALGLPEPVYPLVRRYQPLLNAIFATDERAWFTVPWQEQSSNPTILETYRQQFPQLWQSHDLILHYTNPSPKGYVLRLFVSGNNANTKHTLESIHQLLERELHHPYTLKVIDISKHPEQAESNHVSAIPTLVRVWPQPVKRIIGEFEDLPRVLQIIATA